MMYCDRCQVLSKDGKTCPLCGSRRLRPADEDDPVLLFTAGQEEAERIASAFDDEGIPHMERILGGGSYSSIILGRSRCAQTHIFVPFSKIQSARDVMCGIGALKDDGEGTGQLSEDLTGEEQGKENNGKKQESMSPGRRAALRIFSIVLFLLLVCAVVFGADAIVGAFKSMFH